MRDVPLYAAIAALLLFVALPAAHTTSAASKLSSEVIKDGAKNSGCDYDPYQRLQQMGVIGGGVNVAPQNGQGGLDVALACRLTKFLKWGQDQGCAPRITSGFRTYAQQQAIVNRGASKAGPGGSCHNFGLAIDLSSRCVEKMHQAAPQFQLVSRFPGYPNPGHFQCLEHKAGAGRSSGCRQACNGGIPINPNMDALANTTNAGPPSSGLSDTLRNALYGQQQPPPPPPPMQQQSLPSSQQPTSYFPIPTLPLPGATTSTSSDYYSAYYPTDTGPSIADQLLQLAYGTTSYGTQTTNATSIPLVLGEDDTKNLQGTHATTGTQQTVNGTLTYQAPQTFTAGNADYTGQNGSMQASQTGFLAVLAQLKETLVRLLDVLRPFGIRQAIQGDEPIEHSE